MSEDWASFSTNTFKTNLFKIIQEDTTKRKKKYDDDFNSIFKILDEINVNFEPDPTYRPNVKYIIIGLVLCQILKQKTINIYKPGKEDREILASKLMCDVQTYLIDKCDKEDWNGIIKDIYKKYEGKIRVDAPTKKLIQDGIANDTLSKEILLHNVNNNRNKYHERKKRKSIY